MTLQPKDYGEIPAETVRVAKAAFPKGNVYMKLRDELGVIYKDEAFADLFPQVGHFAESPGCLGLITVLQFAEGLSDRQAAEAVRSRIDWKYFLGLELEDAGFDYSVLSEYRSRLLAGEASERLLDKLIEACRQHKLIKERGKQRTDSTQVHAAVREMNRLEKVGETLRAALNDLAMVAPEWLKERIPMEWYERYGARMEGYRLPKEAGEQQKLAVQIGKDGYQLLGWIEKEGMGEIKGQEAVKILWRIWIQEYQIQDDEIMRRDKDNMPPGELKIVSPYDTEARYSEKRSEGWTGYKTQLTETCDKDAPHLIIHVMTAPATQSDYTVLADIHQDLAEKELLPGEHVVDQGYMDIRHVVDAKEKFGITVIGQPMPDSSWQAKQKQGFDLTQFVVDWVSLTVTCPMKKVSQPLMEGKDPRGNAVLRAEFAATDCQACPHQMLCTRSEKRGRRLTIHHQTEYLALQQLRQYIRTTEFKEKYRDRAGVEGTISEAVRGCGLRATRYIGLAKTHLQDIAIAAAVDLVRLANWFSKIPVAKTRLSPLSALRALPA